MEKHIKTTMVDRNIQKEDIVKVIDYKSMKPIIVDTFEDYKINFVLELSDGTSFLVHKIKKVPNNEISINGMFLNSNYNDFIKNLSDGSMSHDEVTSKNITFNVSVSSEDDRDFLMKLVKNTIDNNIPFEEKMGANILKGTQEDFFYRIKKIYEEKSKNNELKEISFDGEKKVITL